MVKRKRKRRQKKKADPPPPPSSSHDKTNVTNGDDKNDKQKKDAIDQKKTQEHEPKQVIIYEKDTDQQDKMDNYDGGDSSSSESEEGDDLVLEGMMCRVKGVESSSEEEEEEEEEEQEEKDSSEEEEEDQNEPPKKKSKHSKANNKAKANKNDTNTITKKEQPQQQKKKKKKQKKKKANSNKDSDDEEEEENPEPEIINVNFTFCDMNTKYHPGLHTLLSSFNDPIHATQSSPLSSLMITNISVGTVLCIENDDDHNVYGFATVLSLKHYPNESCLHHLSKLCLDHCPPNRKKEMEVVLSGKTKRPCGFLIHARMVNIPLEITEVLHQQLILDMDWAVKECVDEAKEEDRKRYDYGLFVRMAPTYRSGDGDGENGGDSLVYRYFEDEVFAGRADFVYTFDVPKIHGNGGGGGDDDDASQEKKLCTVIVMTKAGHRDAIEDLAKMIHGN